MSIPKARLHQMIEANEAKLIMLRKINGKGVTPTQVECESVIKTCQRLLKSK